MCIRDRKLTLCSKLFLESHWTVIPNKQNKNTAGYLLSRYGYTIWLKTKSTFGNDVQPEANRVHSYSSRDIQVSPQSLCYIYNYQRIWSLISYHLRCDLNASDQRVCLPIVECKSTHRANAEQKTTIDTYGTQDMINYRQVYGLISKLNCKGHRVGFSMFFK